MTQIDGNIPKERENETVVLPNKQNGTVLHKKYELSKGAISVNYQTSLKNLQTTDDFVRGYLEGLASDDQVEFILGQIPPKQEFDLYFNKLSTSNLADLSGPAYEVGKEFKKMYSTTYHDKGIRTDFPKLYEILLILKQLEGLLSEVDAVVCMDEIIAHPEKGYCYLLLTEGENNTICADMISVTYFYATISHFWFITKMTEVFQQDEVTEPKEQTPNPDTKL